MDGFAQFCMRNLPKNGKTLHVSYYALMTLLMILSVIMISMLIVLLCTTLYCKCVEVSDLRQQLELPIELEADLRDTRHETPSVGSGLLLSM